MKLNLTHLKQFLPDLPSDTKKISNDLALIGHFVAGIDHDVLDLEIRSNRPDCLSYFGLAHELSAYYKIPLSFPHHKIPNISSKLPQTPVTINSDDVYRILSLSINDITVKASPDWLVNILSDHNINSINNLVDITNYIMILYGIPCHAFDANLSQQLIWHNNKNKYKTFTSLDGTNIDLESDTLLISNTKKPLSLSFIGGQNSGIQKSTKNTIIEMAVYNPSRVRSDSRNLKTITEASIRLGKDLDPNLIPRSFAHLISLIQKLAGGTISSQLLDLDRHHNNSRPIKIDYQKASLYSGINIDQKTSQNILKNINCTVDGPQITPPSWRTDLKLEEDLLEEIIRINGYNNIPIDQPITDLQTKDITPAVIYTIETIQNKLSQLGYDEIRSWPLSSQDQIINPKTAVYTQNSINSDFPALRQNLIPGLQAQKKQYDRLKLPNTPFFEIGKVYYKKNNDYSEYWSLAIYHPDSKQLQKDLLALNLEASSPLNFAEINIQELKLPKSKANTTKYHAYELNRQITTLDANVEFKNIQDPQKLIKKYLKKIGKSCWNITITDTYQDPKTKNHRYTLQVSYFNLSSKKAKQLHLKTFNLQ